ncbi:class I tRNA ligase family protein [Mycoplasma leonicaptivi]|uniref:class I tRNA ligase family protein n=1 Tax=Mycoplasma leonicaptivi TaxID=36742 RepID=UPI0004805F9E|nr:class I tRNA ligase family protein [Mycoplasma leonicaptivi]
MLKIYVCGPTVYNEVHIGNLRPIITMDLVLKAARNLGKEFCFVHNITDVDDKIINEAIRQNKSEKEITTIFTKSYLDILEKFNVDTVTHFEYVTENIKTIDKFINKIINSGFAYLDGNNVWFNVEKIKDKYGTVSGQKLENMSFENLNHKKNYPADFALWKDTDKGVKFQTSFAYGRPGWHSECVALIYKHFSDEGLDFHGGGMDLTFPHHENENIQFYAVTKNDLTKTWLRTGQININGEKMSKSLQNVFLAKDFIKQFPCDYFKFIILFNGFTSIINIDENLINNIDHTYRKIKRIYFQHALLNDKNNEFNKKDFNLFMQAIFNRDFSLFNKMFNDLIKEINKTKNITKYNLLINVFNSLKFDFCKIDFFEFINIYNNWQTVLKDKDYYNADILRKKLLDEGLL